MRTEPPLNRNHKHKHLIIFGLYIIIRFHIFRNIFKITKTNILDDGIVNFLYRQALTNDQSLELYIRRAKSYFEVNAHQDFIKFGSNWL